MSIQWSTMRTYIRTAILKDVPGVTDPANPSAGEVFSDDQMLIAARWACAFVSMHTAQQAVTTLACDGEAYRFTLPDNIVDGIEKAALVILNDGNTLEYLPPIRLVPSIVSWPSATPDSDASAMRGYWAWPENTLQLSFVPKAGSTIELRYFKVWTPPEADGSILEFGLLFEQPFAYFVGASCFDPLGAQAAAIRTWNRRMDSGVPTDNSLQEQSKFFIKMAEDRLADIAPQDRETFYRVNIRDLGMLR